MEKIAISVEDFATMLGIGRQKAYEIAKTEGFPAVRLGRRVVIPVDMLKTWLAEHTQAAE